MLACNNGKSGIHIDGKNDRQLNEAINEYFTKKMMGDDYIDRQNDYTFNRGLIEKMEKGFGEETLKKAYYQNNSDLLEKKFDRALGEEGRWNKFLNVLENTSYEYNEENINKATIKGETIKELQKEYERLSKSLTNNINYDEKTKSFVDNQLKELQSKIDNYSNEYRNLYEKAQQGEKKRKEAEEKADEYADIFKYYYSSEQEIEIENNKLKTNIQKCENNYKKELNVIYNGLLNSLENIEKVVTVRDKTDFIKTMKQSIEGIKEDIGFYEKIEKELKQLGISIAPVWLKKLHDLKEDIELPKKRIEQMDKAQKINRLEELEISLQEDINILNDIENIREQITNKERTEKECKSLLEREEKNIEKEKKRFVNRFVNRMINRKDKLYITNEIIKVLQDDVSKYEQINNLKKQLKNQYQTKQDYENSLMECQGEIRVFRQNNRLLFDI